MSTVNNPQNVYFYKSQPVMYDMGMKKKAAGINTEALQWAMKREELSQEELAKASGVNKATVSRLLKGEVEGITATNVANLANALGVSIDFLMGRTGDPEVKPTMEMAIAEIVAIAKTLSEFRQRDLLLIAQAYSDAEEPTPETMQKILIIVGEVAGEDAREKLVASLDYLRPSTRPARKRPPTQESG